MRNPYLPLEYVCSVASLMHSVLAVSPDCTLRELLMHMNYVLRLQHQHLSYRASIDWFDNSEFFY